MSFVDGQTLTAAQLNAAFAAAFPISQVQVPGLFTEMVAAGAFVHFSKPSGTVNVQNAVANDATRIANGYVLVGGNSGDAALVWRFGLNSAITVASSADQVWLSATTPGGYVTTPYDPSVDTGKFNQLLNLGPALPGIGIFFFPQPMIGPF